MVRAPEFALTPHITQHELSSRGLTDSRVPQSTASVMVTAPPERGEVCVTPVCAVTTEVAATEQRRARARPSRLAGARLIIGFKNLRKQCNIYV